MWCVEVTFLKADGYTTLLLVLLLMSLGSKKRLFIEVSEKNIHDTVHFRRSVVSDSL